MTDKARQLYEEGLAAFKKGKVLEAQAAYLAAWSLNKHWQIAANLADTEIELGKHREAAEHATYYQQHAPANRKEKADALVKRALARVAALALTVEPEGAEVLVDDVSIGRAPLAGPVFVEPGERRVRARFPGRPDAVQVIAAQAGATPMVTLRVEVPAAPPPARELPAVGSSYKPIVITGGVVAGVGLGLGAVFAVVSNGKASDAETKRATLAKTSGATACSSASPAAGCGALESTLRARAGLADASLWTFVGAGAVGAATLVYALAAPRAKVSAPVQVTPAIGAGLGGVVVHGAW